MNNSYNQIPYETSYLAETDPQLLQARAFLFGLNAKDKNEAKILEIACGSGENLIELAKKYPQSKFLGFDEAEKPISKAIETAKYFGLKNIQFQQKTISDFSSSENFDYIIAHGVFSWVNENNRNKILEIVKNNLSENGVFYISYNIMPGFSFSEVLRNMLYFHSAEIEDNEEKLKHSHNLLNFISETLKFYPENNYTKQFNDEYQKLKSQPDWYIFHEFLEKNNKAFYFYEFVNLIKNFDLQYLSEVSIASMNIENLPKFAYDVLSNVDDILRVEQYIDFILNRKFRASLLCKSKIQLNRNLQNINITDKKFYAKFTLPDALQNDKYKPDDKIIFEFPNGIKTEINNFYLIFAFEYLAKFSSPKNPAKLNEISDYLSKKLTDYKINFTENTLDEVKKMLANNFLITHFRGGIEIVL